MSVEKKVSVFLNSDEIDSAGVDPKTWYNFLRKKEIGEIFRIFGEYKFNKALELGAGDGEQSRYLAKHCNTLICTDIDDSSFKKKASNITFMKSNAEDLSRFDDNYFDLIFSSNMLEHVVDIQKCLNECRRVISPEGVLVFTLPNQVWKIFNFIFYLVRGMNPLIHGVSSSHLNELISFSPKKWRRTFKENNFSILNMITLPFYMGHRNRFLPVLKLGSKLHLSASMCYVLIPKKII